MPVKLVAYEEQDLNTLLSANTSAIFSGLSSQVEDENLLKTPLISIYTDFFYLPNNNNLINQFLEREESAITVGGLFPKAQQLPILSSKPNVSYKTYPGLLELLIDLFNDKLDAVVFFDSQNEDSILTKLLSLYLKRTSIQAEQNQIFAYLSTERSVISDWIQWGNQSAQLDIEVREALINHHNPWWGTSLIIGRNIALVFVAIFILLIFKRFEA
ncbi:hypothetical protein ACLKMH_11650 [Psychromonas sp. KJ10-10]|uniref:hypothetical protein n=1 Tax=Psychromonas sp. KJ10-10 TaxID=3391823 RepID=UPI0039B36A4E